MELRQLEYFVAVVEEASFTRAAQRTHVAQPGVSAQIRRLEAELGQPLLDRAPGGVTPTEAGAAVLPHARAALAAVAGVRLAVDELTGLVRGRVAIGTITSGFTTQLADLLAAFHRAHPAVELSLTEAASDELVAGLRGGALDVALVGLAARAPLGLETQRVAEEPLVAAVATGHTLASRTSVSLHALQEQPLISLPVGTGLRAALDAACAAAGVAPRIAFEASDPVVVAQLAVRGLGVAILPASLAASIDGLRALTVTRPALRSGVVLAWRTGGPSGPAARTFLGRAQAGFAPV